MSMCLPSSRSRSSWVQGNIRQTARATRIGIDAGAGRFYGWERSNRFGGFSHDTLHFFFNNAGLNKDPFEPSLDISNSPDIPSSNSKTKLNPRAKRASFVRMLSKFT